MTPIKNELFSPSRWELLHWLKALGVFITSCRNEQAWECVMRAQLGSHKLNQEGWAGEEEPLESAAEAARGAQAFLNIHYIKFSSFWRFCPQKCSGMVPELWYINPTFHHELSSLPFLSSASILVLSALLLSLPSILFSFWPTHL